MVKGLSSEQLSTDSRGTNLPLSHDLANRTKGRFIASVLSSDRLPDLTAEQVRALPDLIFMFIQSQITRVFTADREPPITCLVSPAEVISAPEGGSESVSVGFTYLFFLGDQLRACKITSKSAIPWSPDTIRGICELDRANAAEFLNENQTLRLYGEEFQITSTSPESIIDSIAKSGGLPARWVAEHIGLSGKDADDLAAILEQSLAEAPRLNATEEFVKTLDDEVTSMIRSEGGEASTKDTPRSAAEIAHQVIAQYNGALAQLENKEGALKTPLDVEDALKQLTPFVATEEGAASLSCSTLLLLLREREILEERVFKVSNETADPRLVDALEQIDPEISLLKGEIQRRKDQGDIWSPDDNVNFVVHPVDLPLAYAEGYQHFDLLINMPTWRVKSLEEEEYEAQQKLPTDTLLRIREILRFFQQRFSSEAELLRNMSDSLRSGLSDDKKVRFGGTREEHRFAFLIQGEPTIKLEFEIGEDLDLHGSPRAFVHNVKIDPFTPEPARRSP